MEKVEISLDYYNRLRECEQAINVLEKSEDKFWVSISRTFNGNCGAMYTSYYLNILTKDQAVLSLQKQIKDLECRLNEADAALIKTKYAEANKPWYKKIFF